MLHFSIGSRFIFPSDASASVTLNFAIQLNSHHYFISVFCPVDANSMSFCGPLKISKKTYLHAFSICRVISVTTLLLLKVQLSWQMVLSQFTSLLNIKVYIIITVYIIILKYTVSSLFRTLVKCIVSFSVNRVCLE